MRFNVNKKSSLVVFFILLLGIIVNHQIFFTEDEIPITSNEDFFTIAIDYFDIDPEDYRLVVGGEVYNPLNLSLEEIKTNFTVTSEIVRLTCIAYKIGVKSTTGVANWTGVRLSEILDYAQINLDAAIDVVFHTPDLSSDGYSTSLTIDESYWDDVILAYEMNSEPLPVLHGFPLRLVCPRFYGYKWIKWVASIEVVKEDYLGFWETGGYYEDSPYVDDSLQIYYPLNETIGLNINNLLFGLEVLLGVIFFGVVGFRMIHRIYKKDS